MGIYRCESWWGRRGRIQNSEVRSQNAEVNGVMRKLLVAIFVLFAGAAFARAGEERAINFANQIVPIFTKAGCNAGGCHGKSSGQNGFKLSLLGFEPSEDYEHLIKEARGRRIFPAAPERSLLLLKATGELPHGGGKRLEKGSRDYELLMKWISTGTPYGHPNDPFVTGIEVSPKEKTMPLGAEQQLAVTAIYSDGSKEDVTRSALYEPNDKELAKVDEGGLVKFYQQPGDVAGGSGYPA